MSNQDKERVAFVLILIVIAVLMMYLGADLTALAECKASGFEHGYVRIDMHLMCEYRLSVPLREILPDIDQPALYTDLKGI